MLSRPTLLFLAAMAVIPRAAKAQQADSALVDRFLAVSGMDSIMHADFEKASQSPSALPPAAAPYRDIFVAWWGKYFDWTSVRTHIVGFIQTRATNDQLRGLIAFYTSPLGQQFVQLKAAVNADYVAFMTAQHQAHVQELMQLLRQRADSLASRPGPSQ
jgi:hypothetical protein